MTNATPSNVSLAPRRARREWLLFFLFAFVLIATGMGLRGPWPADEPRFALVARQMVESGNWLIPHRGTELYADKPPLFMALQALAYELTGNWRIAFLLPSLLFSMGTLWLVYDLGRRLWDHRVGLYAAGALLATFQFVYQAKRAQIDPAETFFITLANYGLLRHLLLGPDWRRYWLGCFAAGLGVITKGVGIIAGLIFLPYLFARWRQWQHLAAIRAGAWRWIFGGACFLLAVALWLVPMLIRVYAIDTPAYLAYAHDILFHQTGGRYAASWDHPQQVWFYLGVILLSWMPLSLTYPATFHAWRERLAAQDARFLLPLGWVVLVLVFFSIPGGKRDVYIMPALPMVALASAPFLQDILQQRWLKRVAWIAVSILGLGFLVAGTYVLMRHPARATTYVEAHGLSHTGNQLWYLLIALGLAALIPALLLRARRGAHALLFGLFGLWMLWSLWAYPLLNDVTSAAGVVRRAERIVGPRGELAMVAWREQNMFLAHWPVAEFGLDEAWHTQLSRAILWQREAPQRRWIFILEQAMKPCIDPAKAIDLGIANHRHWWLFQADAVAADCRDGRVPVAPESPDRNDPE